MSKDMYHDIVKQALMKDGWDITDDPYVLERGKIRYNVDLGAEKLVAARKGKVKILVEVKSFVGASDINEFHRAVGQYVDYLVALEEVEPDRTLFLAVPNFAWNGFFQEQVIKKAIAFIKAKIVVYSPENKTIESWIK